MQAVEKLKNKWRVPGKLAPSKRKHKKYMIERPDGTVVHFGDTRFEDFTIHKDMQRRESYCKRAGGIRGKDGRLTGNDPASPNYYAMRLLWDCAPTPPN